MIDPRITHRPKEVAITVAFPRAEVNMGEPMFRRITFHRSTFQDCMEAAMKFGWTGSIVYLTLGGGRTVVLSHRKED